RGKGVLAVDLTPGFVVQDVWEPPEFQVRFEYADEEVLGPPFTSVSLRRDDQVLPFIWEASARRVEVVSGVQGVFTSQVFLDLEPADTFRFPSYAGGRTPLQTLARLELRPEDFSDLNLGPLRLERLLLDLGAFEDFSNPINRSAALTPTISAGRVVESHAVRLERFGLWSGFTLQGRTDFTGYYYGTAERQVEWLNRLEARQGFGDTGSLSLTFNRDVREGETPFRHDLITYRSRTDLLGAFVLTPLPWLRFEQRGGYVFYDDRNPGQPGSAPWASPLTLLRNVVLVTLPVRNSYDLAESDPGTIDATLDLRRRGDVQLQATIRHVDDLAVLPDRITNEAVDDTATYLSAPATISGAIDLRVNTAYRYAPPEPEPSEPRDHFDDLQVNLTLGTLRQDDRAPGLALTYARDLDAGAVSDFGVELTTRLGPL